MLKGVFLYDRLDSGHWSADHVLMDSPRFGCRSLSSWHVVFMALLLEGAKAEKARFKIPPPWGIARAHRSKGMMDPKFTHERVYFVCLRERHKKSGNNSEPRNFLFYPPPSEANQQRCWMLRGRSFAPRALPPAMGTYTGWAENHTFYVILQWEKNGFEEGFQNPAQNKDSRVPRVPELRIHFPRAQIKDSLPHGHLYRLGRKSYILLDTTMEKTALKKASRVQHRIRIHVSR